MRAPDNQGYTLLEMAIVVVIIGFLAGGAIVGRSLIRSSQLQSVITESNTYIHAMKEFQDKYQELPGDMLDATSYWGALGTCPPTSSTLPSPPSTATCNGDGNGKIGNINASGTGLNKCFTWENLQVCPNESFYAWQHLANAGLINGVFLPSYAVYMSGETVPSIAPGLNAPRSALSPGLWQILYIGTLQGADNNSYGQLPNNLYGHVLWLRGPAVTPPFNSLITGVKNPAYVMTPAEAASIDTKIDDGNPVTGNVISPLGDQCVTFTYSPDGLIESASYNMTMSPMRNACEMIIITGF